MRKLIVATIAAILVGVSALSIYGGYTWGRGHIDAERRLLLCNDALERRQAAYKALIRTVNISDGGYVVSDIPFRSVDDFGRVIFKGQSVPLVGASSVMRLGEDSTRHAFIREEKRLETELVLAQMGADLFCEIPEWMVEYTRGLELEAAK